MASSPNRWSHEARPGVFRREGDTWLVGFGAQTVRLRASKGLNDIATLLARPGREVHVIELVGVATEMGDLPATDRLLDERAMAEYRSRLSELAQEADDADAMHDLGRATSAHAEYDTLVARLSADLGLGGRSRLSDQWPERARKSVRKRVQDALVRIEAENPPLGQHLRQSIRTGAFCVYDPPDAGDLGSLNFLGSRPLESHRDPQSRALQVERWRLATAPPGGDATHACQRRHAQRADRPIRHGLRGRHARRHRRDRGQARALQGARRQGPGHRRGAGRLPPDTTGGWSRNGAMPSS